MTAQNTFAQKYTLFEVRTTKTSEKTPDAMATFIQSLPQIKNSVWDNLSGKSEGLIFEYVVWHQRIYFMIAVGKKLANYFQTQLTAQYPQSSAKVVTDYFPYFFQQQHQLKQRINLSSFAQLKLVQPFYFPLKTYKDFHDTDPLSTVLSTLAKIPPSQKAVVQLVLTKSQNNWQKFGAKIAQTPLPMANSDRTMPHPQKKLIEQKVSQIGFNMGIRILITDQDKYARDTTMENVANAFSNVNHNEGNKLSLAKTLFWQKTGLFTSITNRSPEFISKNQIFTVDEISTLYHLPNKKLSQIKNLAWSDTLKSKTPKKLPIITDNKISQPFFTKVSPLSNSQNQNHQKIIHFSKKKYENPNKKIATVKSTSLQQNFKIPNNPIVTKLPYDHLDDTDDFNIISQQNKMPTKSPESPTISQKQLIGLKYSSTHTQKKSKSTNKYQRYDHNKKLGQKSHLAPSKQIRNIKQQNSKPKHADKHRQQRHLLAERAIQRLAGLQYQSQNQPYNLEKGNEIMISIAQRIKQKQNIIPNKLNDNIKKNKNIRIQNAPTKQTPKHIPNKNRSPYITVVED